MENIDHIVDVLVKNLKYFKGDYFTLKILFANSYEWNKGKYSQHLKKIETAFNEKIEFNDSFKKEGIIKGKEILYKSNDVVSLIENNNLKRCYIFDCKFDGPPINKDKKIDDIFNGEIEVEVSNKHSKKSEEKILPISVTKYMAYVLDQSTFASFYKNNVYSLFDFEGANALKKVFK